MKVSTTRRGVALLALAGAAVATALVNAAPAGAVTHIGHQPGQMSFSQQSGTAADMPTWTSATVCPAPFNDAGIGSIWNTDGTAITTVGNANPNVKTAPFSSNIDFPMGQYMSFGFVLPNVWYEWIVECQDPTLIFSPEQSMWVKWNDDGSWTSTQTAPVEGAVTTTTSLSAQPTSGNPGDTVTLSATVSPSDAVGNVEFFDGTTSLGTVAVSNGTASKDVNTLTSGTHTLTAKFEPTDTAAFTESTSDPVTVTISGGGSSTAGTETVNVNIPQPTEGQLTVTVDQTPVSLGTAQANGSALEATGQLSPVTVNDARTISKPGWSVSGQVSDFTSGGDTIDGNSLGWTPAITAPNSDNDVTAGAAVAPGSNPGLKQGSGLANAAATHGVGQSVLGAGLDLQVPTTTNAGAYGATLTITVIDTAS
jgi:Bacterial Ig-like domain (group 3)